MKFVIVVVIFVVSLVQHVRYTAHLDLESHFSNML